MVLLSLFAVARFFAIGDVGFRHITVGDFRAVLGDRTPVFYFFIFDVGFANRASSFLVDVFDDFAGSLFLASRHDGLTDDFVASDFLVRGDQTRSLLRDLNDVAFFDRFLFGDLAITSFLDFFFDRNHHGVGFFDRDFVRFLPIYRFFTLLNLWHHHGVVLLLGFLIFFSSIDRVLLVPRFFHVDGVLLDVRDAILNGLVDRVRFLSSLRAVASLLHGAVVGFPARNVDRLRDARWWATAAALATGRMSLNARCDHGRNDVRTGQRKPKPVRRQTRRGQRRKLRCANRAKRGLRKLSRLRHATKRPAALAAADWSV